MNLIIFSCFRLHLRSNELQDVTRTSGGSEAGRSVAIISGTKLVSGECLCCIHLSSIGKSNKNLLNGSWMHPDVIYL
jgi:hypothetical protein